MKVLCVMLLLVACGAYAAGRESAFEAANKLYEEGKYSEAAAAYEKMVQESPRSTSLYYNMGTAYYKAGRMGRAVVAFRRAEELTPRDAELRANLQFVRKKVSGEEGSLDPFWRSWLTLLTLNEGTVLAGVFYWIWFVLLALREWKPALKSLLRGYTLWAGLLAGLFTALLVTSAIVRSHDTAAVVVVREATVRFGPLDESQTSFHLADGTEVSVVDTKDNWLKVRDRSRRVGWLKRDQVEFVSNAPKVNLALPPKPPSPRAELPLREPPFAARQAALPARDSCCG